MKETRTYPLAVMLTLTTGRLLCTFAQFHEAAEFIMGYPIWTHEFGSQQMFDRLRAAVLEQFPQLEDVNTDAVDPTTWEAFLWLQQQRHRSSFEVQPGTTERTKGPIETLERMRV